MMRFPIRVASATRAVAFVFNAGASGEREVAELVTEEECPGLTQAQVAELKQLCRDERRQHVLVTIGVGVASAVFGFFSHMRWARRRRRRRSQK